MASSKHSKYQEIERQWDKPMADILILLYERFGDKPNRQELVAQELGVSQSRVSDWIRLLGLQMRLVAPETPIACTSQPTFQTE